MLSSWKRIYRETFLGWNFPPFQYDVKMYWLLYIQTYLSINAFKIINTQPLLFDRCLDSKQSKHLLWTSYQSGGRFKYEHCHVRGSIKIAKLLNSKYNLQWNDYNLNSRSLEMSSLIFIFRLDFWIVIHLWNRLYSSFYILGRAKPVPPPRSHSLEQHNYADHKKQPTTATGKDTKDKGNPFQEVHIKEESLERHTFLW